MSVVLAFVSLWNSSFDQRWCNLEMILAPSVRNRLLFQTLFLLLWHTTEKLPRFQSVSFVLDHVCRSLTEFLIWSLIHPFLALCLLLEFSAISTTYERVHVVTLSALSFYLNFLHRLFDSGSGRTNLSSTKIPWLHMNTLNMYTFRIISVCIFYYVTVIRFWNRSQLYQILWFYLTCTRICSPTDETVENRRLDQNSELCENQLYNSSNIWNNNNSKRK